MLTSFVPGGFLCLVIQSCPTLCDPMDCSLPGFSVHGDSPGKSNRVGCHALLQRIFPTQGLNPCLLWLLHCRWIFTTEPSGKPLYDIQFSSVQLLSRVLLFAIPWTAAHQASLFITNSQSLLKLTSTESVMPSNHLILCHRPLLLPSVFPSIRVFSNESVLQIRWPKYWSFGFSLSPSDEYSGTDFH